MAWINSTEQTILTCAIYLFASPINFSSSFKRKMQHNISDLDHIEVLLFPTLEEEFHPCFQKCEVKSLSVELHSYYNEIVMRWQNLLRQYLFIHKGSIYLYHILMTITLKNHLWVFFMCTSILMCMYLCVHQALWRMMLFSKCPSSNLLFEVLRSVIRVSVKESTELHDWALC